MDDSSGLDGVLESLLGDELVRNEPMSRHTTLRVGGPAQWYWPATNVGRLAAVLTSCYRHDIPYLLVGHGSNLLMSDAGYSGLIIQNRCKATSISERGADNLIYSESGVSLGSLFSQTARAGYSGLEWGVGIPGTVGGALVSNAGAYRGNIGPLVRSIRVFADGEDLTVGPEWMEFSYRDSRLRRSGIGRSVVLSCTLELVFEGNSEAILERARRYQQLRKSKQPFYPSAGSFFKNVMSPALAANLPGLPNDLRVAGVVPAGYIIEECGLKGLRVGGAQSSEKHANFLINVNRTATASDFDALATLIKRKVNERFGVNLEEEVLYVGNWPTNSNLTDAICVNDAVNHLKNGNC
jgi:UDP-N-acetylmuramate dehydrogenase